MRVKTSPSAFSPPQPMAWKTECTLQGEARFVKNILEMHAGEARLVGPRSWWEPLRPSQAHYYRKARFWHCQFVKTKEMRAFLSKRMEGPGGDSDLLDRDISMIMEHEQDETAVLKLERTPGNAPASGGEQTSSETWRWLIRGGNCVTLAECFYWGMDTVPCFDLYNLYMEQEVWIRPKLHGASHTPCSELRRNAKNYKFFKTGRAGWG